MCLNNPNLFVISGGPGSGKTTVLRELAKFGVKYAPEVVDRIAEAPPITRVRFILERLPSCHLSR